MAQFEHKFHWADYLLFALSLAMSFVVGLVIAIKEKWLKQSSESYLMANRQMNWFLVAMSILATSTTALLFVGFTTEFYYYGFTAVWILLTNHVGTIPVAIFVIPKFYRLGFKLTSAYSYFQYRFNLTVRMVASFLYFLLTLLYLSVVLYIPSLVMAQVSTINVYWSIFLGAMVCTLYTAFGGMKAVIWVDTIQIFIILIGTLTLAVKGSISAGGISKVWETYSGIGQRNLWDDTNTAFYDRHNVWNVIFGLGFLLMSRYGTDQSLLQRYMTVPDMRRSQTSILVGATVALLFQAVVMIMAMAAFAEVTIGGNEPLLLGKIDKKDQIMPYFLMNVLGQYHGIPGLVIAAIFAAALSTISSGQTGLAAVFLEDFIKPIYKICTSKNLSVKQAGVISKATGIIVGLIVLAIAMTVPSIGDNVVDMALSFQAFILGPLLGIMFAGLLCFWVESWGALTGLLAGVAWTMMLYFGAMQYGNEIGLDQPPLFLHNYSVVINIPVPTAEPTFWDISYTWYTITAVVVVLVVSTVISLIVHCIRRASYEEYGWKQIMPSKDLRYTMEDFLVAMGCRKNERETVDETEYEVIAKTTDSDSINIGHEMGNMKVDEVEYKMNAKTTDSINIGHEMGNMKVDEVEYEVNAKTTDFLIPSTSVTKWET